MVAREIATRRKERRRQRNPVREKGAEGISRHWRARRGQDSLVCGAGSHCGRAFGLRRRATAHFVRCRGQELRRGLPRRAGSDERRATREIRREAEGLPAAEASWGGDL